jgi:hypothetical protein
MPTVDPRSLFDKLNQTKRDVICLLSVHYAPISRTALLDAARRLGLKTEKGKAFAHGDMKSIVDHLLQKKLILERNRAIACPSNLANIACEWLLRHNRFDSFANAVGIKTRHRHPGYFSPYSSYEHFLGHLRAAIYLGELEDFFAMIDRAGQSHYRDQSPHVDVFASMGGGDFRQPWFQRLSPELRMSFLSLPLERALFRLEPVDHLIRALQDEVAENHWDLPEILIEALLLQGKAQEARKQIGHPETPEQAAQLAWASMVEGDYPKARILFEQAYEQLLKGTRKRNVYFQGLAGIFLVAAQLDGADQAHVLALRERLKRGAKQKDNAIAFHLDSLSSGVSALLGDVDTLASPDDWVFERIAPGIGLLLYCLPWQWRGKLAPKIALGRIQETERIAGKNGYAWIAGECRQFAERLQGKPAPFPVRHLVDAVQPMQEWERALKALALLGHESEAPVKPIKKGLSRLIWLLDFDEYGDVHLEPKEQKATQSGGWTKGRTLGLKRLAEASDQLDFLTPQDAAVVNHIRNYSRYSYDYYRDHYEIDTDQALPVLAGHPLLFLKESPSTQVEVETASPILEITKQGDILKLALVPNIDPDEELLIIRQSPTRISVIPIDQTMRRVARIIGKELTVPTQAEPGVREAVANIAPMLTVHSEVSGMSDGLEEANADSKPYLHILPVADGLSFEMFNHPFGIEGPGFKPGEGAKGVIAEVDGTKLHTMRERSDETARAKQVLEACPALEPFEIDRWHWQTDDPEDSLEILAQCKGLGDGRINLVWPRGEKLRLRAQVGAGNMSMRLRQRHDWFEAEGELTIDDRLTLSLARLLELTQDSKGRFLKLDDGEYLELTQRLKQQLDELRSYAGGKGKDIRFHPLTAGGIEAIGDEFGTFEVDDAWKRQLQRLQEAREQVAPVPSTLTAELRDYQQEGFAWLSRLATWRAGACLADDMGLGKTLQALALIVSKAPAGPSLVVAPTSVCANWLAECHRFAPTLKPILFGGGDRRSMIEEAGPFDLIVTSYGLMQQSIEHLQEKPWQTLILDEAQAIKNSVAKRSKAAAKLIAEFKIALTGTPVENHLGELWSLFNFLNPGLLGSLPSFNERFAGPIELQQDQAAKQRLKRLVQPFLLRRLKAQVLEELPSRTEIVLHVEMSKEETAFYEAIRQKAVEQFTDDGIPDEKKRFRVLAEITRLRQACCNPNLIAPELGLPSAKQKVLLNIVDELLENRHKALVFSQFVTHLTLVRKALDSKGIRYQYLDGSTPAKERRIAVDAFQAGQGDLFLISLKAGGTGLNLTAADYVIHLDPWWNPAVEDQASDRAHRIGQQRPVTIYRLVTKATIEDKIVELHNHKRDLADNLLEGAESSAKLSTEDILALLKDTQD